ERYARGVHLRAGESIIHHRRDHLLPVRPEVEVLLQQREPFAQSVEGEHIVAAAHRGGGAQEPYAGRHAAVAAVLVHQQWAPADGAVDLEKVARQRRALVRDAYLLHRRVQERGAGVPQRPVAEPGGLLAVRGAPPGAASGCRGDVSWGPQGEVRSPAAT